MSGTRDLARHIKAELCRQELQYGFSFYTTTDGGEAVVLDATDLLADTDDGPPPVPQHPAPT